ncbi:MAG: pantetheine-phosphate adenylyltransferase [Zymomonas mobilis subsp. pomaceae]|uniref:Phosphopantetheine adenylyltransferase n=1 Tax=Zymomonas mobilis subsp. pomaceae (strain ATCC 29192 / DSM 22645 / JCM 10191 / CCUG 17912 / NBRC 13757 / NCIMB 11200 / NRRL B-4491 / Barker I) TaxID=579138 RepID=F8EVA7_ZYMMT|nr:pantetheine-phosphate adenylyltransferase [Zymomonas mobilis]AEI37314.1 pantetheine-phosphate adenylyltransferase [Zymomonas mobilis subsp. pomaceae ATCC 29192]MDX5948682.1 pantetheine-phosphate adenylyltransferase [Zymomonas mobilis subsp. pomaceae]GEB88487.1 phosphopantetheine adenylyltransferase [Zymomonas mobilis subsp. pomaceae]
MTIGHKAQKRIAIYPGTFDPITLGHVDIIRRGARIFDHLIVAIADNPGKSPLFSSDERAAMVRHEIEILETSPDSQIEVITYDSLLMHCVQAQGASVILRGLRAVADFEYEYQMAGMNQQIDNTIETMFLMADCVLQPIASRLVKEVAFYEGNITPFVSPHVAQKLQQRMREKRREAMIPSS